MNKLLIGFALLLGLAAAVPASAQTPRHTVPQAATLGHGGMLMCPYGWTLVQSARWVTYYELQTQTQFQRQCTMVGPLGFCRAWINVPVTVQVAVPITRLVPANMCIYTGYNPVPGPIPYP